MPKSPPPVLPAQEVPIAPLLDGSFGTLVGPRTSPGRLEGCRVLVVEDNDDARDLICALLANAGAEMLCVGSVAEAMAAVRGAYVPDVVLTDFAMPHATGLDFIREYRKATAPSPAAPVLVVSGNSENDWRERALEAGAADVVSKPFEPTQLIARLAAAVRSAVESGRIRTA